jgi:hypothetical protein
MSDTYICQECGSEGEGGEVEDNDGRCWHFRKIIRDGKVREIRCYGEMVKKSDTILAGDR